MKKCLILAFCAFFLSCSSEGLGEINAEFGQCKGSALEKSRVIPEKDAEPSPSVNIAEGKTQIYLPSVNRPCYTSLEIKAEKSNDTLKLEYYLPKGKDYVMSSCSCESNLNLTIESVENDIKYIIFGNNQPYQVGNLDGLSSSSILSLSSNSELSSSSVENRPPLCKSNLAENTFNFNKQGGVDTVGIGGTSIRIMGHSSDILTDMYDNKKCDFFLSDHYTYGENFSTIKVESDYCKNNYCSDESERLASGSPYNTPVMKIDCHWVSVAHFSKDSLQISVNKNETGEERSVQIPLTGGGCALTTVANINIIQHAGE